MGPALRPPPPSGQSPLLRPQLTWLRVLLTEDSRTSRGRAADLLAEWQPHVESQHHTRLLIDTLILRALWARAEGDAEAATAALGLAITLARPAGVCRPFLDWEDQLAGLLERVKLEGDDTAFVCDVLALGTRAKDATPSPARLPLALDVAAALSSPLSDREAEILAPLAERLTNKEIAGRPHITPETVKHHTANIYQKLDVHGRREAVERARSLGVLQLP